jgi:hypothetical protein
MAKYNKKDKYTAPWWHSQISTAEDRHQTFLKDAKESIEVYRGKKDLDDTQRRLNVWWYVINTLLPAYYSSTPKAEVRLRKRVGGMPYQLGSVVLERCTQFAMDEFFDFDDVGYNAALQFLLTGRGVLWARYEAEFEEKETEIALLRGVDGGLVDANGKPFEEEDDAEIITTPEGLIVARMSLEIKDDERAILESVNYNDYLKSDGRTESEVEWKARRAFMSKEEVIEKFGKEVADDLSFDSYPEALKNLVRQDSSKYEGKAELWEIWCKATEKVYWLQQKGEKSILESGEPPIEYEGFWPCSEINQSVDPNNTIPVSDYIHVKDQILEVERLTTRIASTTQAVRTTALYDATMGPQVEQLLQGDLKYIPVHNWPSYKGRGGQGNGIEYLDIGPYVQAIEVLQNARNAALEKLYETLKVSDLLRGTSAEYKTATANRLENQWSSLGLIVRQNQFAKFVSEGINKIGTIIASKFSPEYMFEIADADSLLMPLVSAEMDPMQAQMQLQGMKDQIAEVLQDDDKRVYRIEIASDSMVALDQAQEKADGLELLETTGQFFEQMKAMVEAYPTMSIFALELMQNMVRRFKGGKDLDALFTKALMDTKQLADKKAEEAAKGPPPDPYMEQVQVSRESAQMRFQIDQAKLQLESQQMQQAMAQTQVETQAKMAASQIDVEIAYRKAQLDEFIQQQKAMIEQQMLQLKSREIEIELMRVQAEASVKADSTMAKREADRVAQLIDLQRLELENMAVRMKESEKLLEERRLNQEQELEKIRIGMQQQVAMVQNAKTETPAPAPINITIDGKKSGKRTITKVVGPDGATQYQEEYLGE